MPTNPEPDWNALGLAAREKAAVIWQTPHYRNLAIGIAVVAVAYLVWQRPDSEAAIKLVLKKDRAIAQQVEQRSGILDKYWSGASLVSELAGEMDAIDLSDCPQDFQAAYKRHVQAWGSVALVKSTNEGFAGAIKGFFTAGLAVGPTMSELEQAMKEVANTWSQVQQCAISHGVAP